MFRSTEQPIDAAFLAEPRAADEGGLESVDLVLSLIERLADAARPLGVSQIARELSISKARAHRHLRALLARGYVRQDAQSEGYEIAVKLMGLGERVRDRFDVLAAIRPEMASLREATGQAVTASALVEGAVVILDLLHGRTLIEFGVRPGARLAFHSSAHGLAALAFGPPHLFEAVMAGPLEAWTSATVTRADRLAAAVARVRDQGWAIAPDQAMIGVNALAVPVFDHRGAWRGTIAIVGSTQFIKPRPDPVQIEAVKAAAAAASSRLGFKATAP